MVQHFPTYYLLFKFVLCFVLFFSLFVDVQLIEEKPADKFGISFFFHLNHVSNNFSSWHITKIILLTQQPSFKVSGLPKPSGTKFYSFYSNNQCQAQANSQANKITNMLSRWKKRREKRLCNVNGLTKCSNSLLHPQFTCYQDRVKHKPRENPITHTWIFYLSVSKTSLRTTNKAPCQPFFLWCQGIKFITIHPSTILKSTESVITMC